MARVEVDGVPFDVRGTNVIHPVVCLACGVHQIGPSSTFLQQRFMQRHAEVCGGQELPLEEPERRLNGARN